MAITVNEAINIKFNVDMASLNKAMGEAKKETQAAVTSINKNIATIGKVAAVGFGIASTAIGILAYKGIQANLAMEEFRGTVGGLSDNLKEAQAKSDAFIATLSTPFYLALNAGLERMNQLMGDAAPNAMEAMGQTMRDIAVVMIKALSAVAKGVNALVAGFRLAVNGYELLWAVVTNNDSAMYKLIDEGKAIKNTFSEANKTIEDLSVTMQTAVFEGDSFSDLYTKNLETFRAMGVTADKAKKVATEATEKAARWKTELTEIGQLYKDIGSEISGQFTNMFVDWQEGALDFGATMRNVLNNIAAQIFEMAVSKQIGGFITNLLGSSFGGATTTSLAGIDVSPFARGGVVNSPTIFPMASGVGLMGEAGAEAILPLTRMGGDLGVKAEASPVNVNVMNYGNDNVQVEQSDGNINVIISQIAQSISRGTGDIGNAIEGRYGIRKQ